MVVRSTSSNATSPVDGIRDELSVHDIKDQWGIERQSNYVYVFPDDEEEIVTNVPEWRDRLADETGRKSSKRDQHAPSADGCSRGASNRRDDSETVTPSSPGIGGRRS